MLLHASRIWSRKSQPTDRSTISPGFSSVIRFEYALSRTSFISLIDTTAIYWSLFVSAFLLVLPKIFTGFSPRVAVAVGWGVMGSCARTPGRPPHFADGPRSNRRSSYHSEWSIGYVCAGMDRIPSEAPARLVCSRSARVSMAIPCRFPRFASARRTGRHRSIGGLLFSWGLLVGPIRENLDALWHVCIEFTGGIGSVKRIVECCLGVFVSVGISAER